MTNVGQVATCELATAAAPAPGRFGTRPVGLDRGRAGAAFGARDLRGAGQPHADPADARSGADAAAGERVHRAVSARRSSPAKSGASCRRAGAGGPRRPAARPHRRTVFADRGRAGDPGGRGRKRHARPRARSFVLAADAIADRELVDRRRGLCARARPDRARRHHRDRDRAGARQAVVRPEPRAVPPVRAARKAAIRGLPARSRCWTRSST